jgi:Flp pilus assembly protein TadD
MPTADEKYDEAIVLQQAGKLQEAIGKLEQLIADSPDFALAHAGLGVFYGKLEQYDKAVEHARKVCQLDPDDPFSFMALSMICQKAGLRAEAEKAMGEAMEKQWSARKGI